MNKILCWLFGHEYRVITRNYYGKYTVEHTEFMECIRCGKRPDLG